MDKNIIWAALLSFLVLFLWFHFFGSNNKNVKDLNNQTFVQSTTPKIVPAESITSNTASIFVLNSTINKKYNFILENDVNKITFNQNGEIVSFFVKEKNNKNVELIYQSQSLPLSVYPKIIYNQNPIASVKGKSITLSGKINNDIAVKTTYKFVDGKCLLNIQFQIQNLSANSINISNFKIGLGPGIATDENLKESELVRYMELLYFTDGKLYKKPKEGSYPMHNSWFSVNNNYFMSSLIDKNDFFKSFEVINKKIPTAFYSASNINLEPNQIINIDLDSIWGIKNYKYLKSFDKNLELEKNISLGFFSGIGKLILALLSLFYSFTGNYGWAIILLTTILQLILLPLNKKSYKSMHAMKQLQPKLENLKLKYKSDPQRLNMEMMLLYKTEKVNPFSGCLPLLLQLPIFWALFTALRSAPELRHAPFIFWIHDLSRPDTVASLGTIPINILPIFMTITMFFSQKLNMGAGNTVDPMQSKMLMLMPLLFLFMFWSFPSGLVLYWLVSNLYTIGLNSYLTLHNTK